MPLNRPYYEHLDDASLFCVDTFISDKKKPRLISRLMHKHREQFMLFAFSLKSQDRLNQGLIMQENLAQVL